MDERKHAIVIGASMAGLLATRVLSNHFTQVTLVERDPVLISLPSTAWRISSIRRRVFCVLEWRCA